MALITTQTHPKLLWEGLHKLWGDHFYRYHDPKWNKVFEVKKSRKAFEEVLGLTAFGLAPEKPQGSPVSYDSEEQGYLKRFTHITYGLGFAITEEEQEDNLYEELAMRRTPAVARSMRETVETIDWNVFNNAFTAGATAGPDGKAYIATDHPNVTGGTAANRATSGVDLSEVAIEDEVIRMMQAENDRGLKMNIKPKLLVTHPNEFFNAQRILGSNLQSGTANNDINVLKSESIIPQGNMSVPYLTDTDAWFIRTDVDGLCHFWRRMPKFTEDNEFSTDNHLYKGTMRFSSGFYDWRSLYGSPGA